eukprot:SAG11_NODE_366_length_10128_cov_4.162030_3_plen_262_part_00
MSSLPMRLTWIPPVGSWLAAGSCWHAVVAAVGSSSRCGCRCAEAESTASLGLHRTAASSRICGRLAHPQMPSRVSAIVHVVTISVSSPWYAANACRAFCCISSEQFSHMSSSMLALCAAVLSGFWHPGVEHLRSCSLFVSLSLLYPAVLKAAPGAASPPALGGPSVRIKLSCSICSGRKACAGFMGAALADGLPTMCASLCSAGTVTRNFLAGFMVPVSVWRTFALPRVTFLVGGKQYGRVGWRVHESPIITYGLSTHRCT